MAGSGLSLSMVKAYQGSGVAARPGMGPRKNDSTRSRPDAWVITFERVASQIYLIRSRQVILDSDLAELYGVSTGRLNEQVTRNRGRFPEDFMFRLNSQELEILNDFQACTLAPLHPTSFDALKPWC